LRARYHLGHHGLVTKARLVLLCTVAAIACGGPSRQPHETHEHGAADPLAAETAAFERARPVFVARCSRCHSKDDTNARPISLEHFDMTSYPFGGHHAGEIAGEIREVLGIGGGKPTMPKDAPGTVAGDELARVAAWADAWDRADKAGAHGEHHHGGEHHHH